jgi:hypothetical protein
MILGSKFFEFVINTKNISSNTERTNCSLNITLSKIGCSLYHLVWEIGQYTKGNIPKWLHIRTLLNEPNTHPRQNT